MRILFAALLTLAACSGPVGGPTPTPATTPLSVVELKYRLFDQLGRPWYCDPDFYPVARADELDLARERLAEMRGDAAGFASILGHNGLAAGAVLTDAQLMSVYRDWKALRALQLELKSGSHAFSYRVQKGGEQQGDQVDGTVDLYGRIDVSKRTAVGPLMCPICLSQETLIDTPLGPMRVTELHAGLLVWSTDSGGSRVAVPIVDLGSADAPPGHEVVRLTLADGRRVTASPGHPTSDGRVIGALRPGDPLDGSVVAAAERLPYRGRTYDLLPAGETHTYWADGVLLGSSLAR